MKLKTARKGAYAGNQFWGCSNWPACNGIINIDGTNNPNQTNMPGGPKNTAPTITTDIPLDYIDDTFSSDFQTPISVRFKCSDSSRSIRVFEAVAVPRMVVEKIHNLKGKISQKQISAFAQWRLETPKQKHSIDEKTLTVISTLEKILLRGRITPCSPSLPNSVIENLDYLNLFEAALDKYRCFPIPMDFESDAEDDFFMCMDDSTRKMGNWILTQVPLSSLTEDESDPDSEQRVDFLLAHPKLKSIVVEIDGPHHQALSSSDRKRDSLLESKGYSVIRIPSRDVESFDISNYPQLSLFVSQLDAIVDDSSPSSIPEIEKIFLTRAASQLQIALLEALKLGYLKINQDCKWKINLIPPYWTGYPWKRPNFQGIFEAAISDLAEMVEKLFIFQHNRKVKIRTSLTYEQDIPRDSLPISFNGTMFLTSGNPNSFNISDIYLPIRIAQKVTKSKPVTVENPDEEVARYFFNYIFGWDKFRKKQWEPIARIAKDQDTILLLPTGHGKSMVYQLASFLLPGICLIIDPLISLIDDQLDNLGFYGIDRVVGITSALSQSERISALSSFAKGHYLFCYVAPERFQIKEFRDALTALTEVAPINLITIDEAHCVSEWGHDFRVSYLNIARNARSYATKEGFVPPILAATGTASRSVLRDMRRELDINELEAVVSLENFDRPNLRYEIITCKSGEKFDRLFKTLLDLPAKFAQSSTFFDLRDEQTHGGLIFLPHVNGKFGVGETYKLLRDKEFGQKVGIYSGSKPKFYETDDWDVRKKFEAHQFKINKKNILVCTNAFGMGIDKRNIHYTIHMNIPRSIEAAYQEAGRAGRDQVTTSYCYFIVSPDNEQRIRKLLNPVTPLVDVEKELESIPYGEDDDISRQIFFHLNSFEGFEKEIAKAASYITQIPDLQVKKMEYHIDYTETEKVIIEKAVHRLLTIGVFDDYEVDYAHQRIIVRLSGFSPQKNLNSYLHYIENYDSRMANNERIEAVKVINQPHKNFAIYLLNRLVRNFIYGVVEQSRRRSLSEMLQACTNSPTNESFRARILNYFNISHYSSFVEECIQGLDPLTQNMERIVDELRAPVEAAELRGQVSRQLEAYPRNPSLLLLRSLAEIYSKDGIIRTIFQNYTAFLAFSKSAWGLSSEETIPLASKYINLVGGLHPDLAEELVVATIEMDSSEYARDYLLENCKDEFTSYLIDQMLGNIVDMIDTI